MWLTRLIGRAAGGPEGPRDPAEAHPPRGRGFGEAPQGGLAGVVSGALAGGATARSRGAPAGFPGGFGGGPPPPADPADRAPPSGWSAPGRPRDEGRGSGGPAATFASTGPHGHRCRMRERLLDRGPDSLADYEMLEMLLFFAFKTGDTKPLAKALINRYGSFAAVLAAPQRELLETRGLGPHSVAAIKLVQAAALRLARAEVIDRPVLNNWERLTDYLSAALSRERVEQFRVLFLDPKNRLIADEAQARGTVNHTPVYPREVVKRALELHATALILVHNHPSGDPTPSRADVEMTAEVKSAAGVLGIVLHDHLILGNGRWTSFRREGLL